MEFVSSGSFVALSNLYSAGDVSEEFSQEGSLRVRVGMLVSRGLAVCGCNTWSCYFLTGVTC